MVGLAALPSCLVWAHVANRWGNIPALVMAYLLQALGVLLPVIAPNVIGVYMGSILFGGTFMGITTTATTLGRSLRPQDSTRCIGLMTGIYGIGQIVGAAGAGVLANLKSVKQPASYLHFSSIFISAILPVNPVMIRPHRRFIYRSEL